MDANQYTEATRQEMSDAKLPLAYRDSCANLLIPLNRCRYEEYYLPWKCEVRHTLSSTYKSLPNWRSSGGQIGGNRWKGWIRREHKANTPTARKTLLREVPIRRVQEARREDG